MTQTEIYKKLEEIRQDETRELIEALKAHGGSYNWWEAYQCGDCVPQIDVRRRTFNGNVEEAWVTKITINENSTIQLEGYVGSVMGTVSFSSEEALVGELIGIINYIK